ncbi:hypothetical protein FS837_007980, partial [Tulasnella sp. UAMH 9824]
MTSPASTAALLAVDFAAPKTTTTETPSSSPPLVGLTGSPEAAVSSSPTAIGTPDYSPVNYKKQTTAIAVGLA